MISVTVAAQGKAKKLFSGNFRAYGSGRLSICDLEKSTNNEAPPNEAVTKTLRWKCLMILNKLCKIFAALIFYCMPSIFTYPEKKYKKFVQTPDNSDFSLIFDEKVLISIFNHLPHRDLFACKTVCSRWHDVINNNPSRWEKVKTDQIRILFDEGEVVIYPIDEKKSPIRHPLPPLQILQRRLRNLTTQSLFVRGLIPVESIPVLRMLLSLDLNPQQLYFIWSKFSPDSIVFLEHFVQQNSHTITDFGLEECSPSHLLTDTLLSPILDNVTSLRLWNNGKGSCYGITDQTLQRINRSLQLGMPIETIDLGTCYFSNEAVVNVVRSWKECATSDLAIMLSNCYPVNKSEVIKQLSEHNIILKKKQQLFSRSFTLTLVC